MLSHLGADSPAPLVGRLSHFAICLSHLFEYPLEYRFRRSCSLCFLNNERLYNAICKGRLVPVYIRVCQGINIVRAKNGIRRSTLYGYRARSTDSVGRNGFHLVGESFPPISQEIAGSYDVLGRHDNGDLVLKIDWNLRGVIRKEFDWKLEL